MDEVKATELEVEIHRFNEMPIHSFHLPRFDLSIPGFVSYGYETYPEDYVGFNIDYDNKEYIEKYLANKNAVYDSDVPCVYLDVIKFDLNAATPDKKLGGGFSILVQIAKYQNFEDAETMTDLSHLKAAQQKLWDIECKEIEGFKKPNFRTEDVSGRQYLVQDVGFENDLPVYLFTLPIDHRHALMIDVTFEGFLPMGTPFPPELHEACMDVVKDFLSHIELSPRD